VIGHSHGGSVLSAALIEAAARKLSLSHMRRWITVGTPFVELRKEHWLFTRLSLAGKVLFVASMMLLVMFLVYILAEITAGSGDSRWLFGATFPGVLAVMGVMMSLPIVFFYFVLNYLDRLSLKHYSRRIRQRACDMFAARWLSLTHVDDEAVQGLAFLPGAKLFFFDKAFAVSTITITSVLALPAIYVFLLYSPASMVRLADWMKVYIYESRSSPATEQAIHDLRQKFFEQHRSGGNNGFRAFGGGEGAVTSAERRSFWQDYLARRAELESKYPDLHAAERALRFKNRFFEEGGKPCIGGQLCGAGEDIRVNSGLLLHLVTDELSWALGAETMVGGSPTSRVWRLRWLEPLALAAVLVPIIFGLVALVLMVAIRYLARFISGGLADLLNLLTNAEVKRAAFGNDTDGEVALGALDRPVWLDRSPVRLPVALGELVTGYSNGIATHSIAKFRQAIGRLALAEPKHTADTAITTYFTWKELVHSSYFDVPEFRKLVAQATARADGFAPSALFKSDADFARTAQWLAEIEGAARAAEPPGAASPTSQDAGAVAAAVASTVKAAP
jgi:hypothetical protein